jgi:hypothetical protein
MAGGLLVELFDGTDVDETFTLEEAIFGRDFDFVLPESLFLFSARSLLILSLTSSEVLWLGRDTSPISLLYENSLMSLLPTVVFREVLRLWSGRLRDLGEGRVAALLLEDFGMLSTITDLMLLLVEEEGSIAKAKDAGVPADFFGKRKPVDDLY